MQPLRGFVGGITVVYVEEYCVGNASQQQKISLSMAILPPKWVHNEFVSRVQQGFILPLPSGPNCHLLFRFMLPAISRLVP